MKKLNSIFNNYGIAIVVLTIIVRFLLFPLAQKSYTSMAKMKALQPRMNNLKEVYGEDKVALNKAVVEMYKNEKINPLSGIFPILLQIPIFFALFRVLSVSIEIKGAPFIWWIKDLSEPDPTSIFNLFSLLPYAVPAFLKVGVLPLLMGGTMYVQQKLGNTGMQTKEQEKVMAMLPFIFTFMFASFPSGLMIYWIVSNVFSISQQYFLTKKFDKK